MRWNCAWSNYRSKDRKLLRLRFELGATNRSVALAWGVRSRLSAALGQVYGDLMECIQRNAGPEKQGGRQ